MPSLRKRERSGKRTTWDIRYQLHRKAHVYTIGETDRRTAEHIYKRFCEFLAEGRIDRVSELELLKSGIPSPEALVAGDRQLSTSLRLSDIANHALNYAHANKSPKTLELEQFVFRKLARELGDPLIDEITPALVEEYKAVRLKTGAPSTINIEIRVLNAAIRQAEDTGLLRSQVKAFKQIRRPDPEAPDRLNDEQIGILLDSCKGDYFRLVVFLLNTGCRRNEALGITWDDIDLKRRQLVVRSKIGKMGKRRTIPLNDTLIELFNEWPHRRQGKLFPDFKSNQVSMAFRRLREAAGLPKGISLHSLRATFASQLIERKVDIFTVSKLLGHSSVKVTEKHYLSLDPEHFQSAVKKLDYRGPPEDEKNSK